MARKSKDFSIEDALTNIENYTKRAMLSYTDVGMLLGKNPSVIAQYAKADLIHPIQQGSKKMISMKEVYLLSAYMHAVENYGCSYVACKIIGALLEETSIKPERYKSYLKSLEKKANLTEDKIANHVNSYKNRGIFQKQKAQQSKEDIYICTECSSSN